MMTSGGTQWVVPPAVEAADPWRALRQIVNTLGPDRAGCAEGCEGCTAERTEALRIARDALWLGVALAVPWPAYAAPDAQVCERCGRPRIEPANTVAGVVCLDPTNHVGCVVHPCYREVPREKEQARSHADELRRYEGALRDILQIPPPCSSAREMQAIARKALDGKPMSAERLGGLAQEGAIG